MEKKNQMQISQRLRFILLQEMRGGIESQSDWRKINHMTDKEKYEELYKKYNILCEEYRDLREAYEDLLRDYMCYEYEMGCNDYE